ncbi:MAG: GlsB/YeaQ/YmgE family stress response membrane protein [Bacteroidaceae bacterium]|nr:GlsB/YeaQ/YmgE family stress response membrane protein [Bacteroidaceae bacterium]
MLYGLIVGLVAGLIAGWIMKGSGYGIIWDIIIGIIGGVFGSWLFEQLHITWGGTIGSIGTAVVGAVVLIWLFRLITGKK